MEFEDVCCLVVLQVCRIGREMGAAGVLVGSRIVASWELPATADASVEVEDIEIWCLVFFRVCRFVREMGAAGVLGGSTIVYSGSSSDILVEENIVVSSEVLIAPGIL